MSAMKENLNVLAVDDMRTDMAVLTAMLEKMGHTVMQARSGEQAVELFRQAQPDLVLMDVIMPGIGGIEAVRQMRSIAGEHWLPIVFVSSIGESEDVVRGIEAGGDDYLLKPINYQIMQAKLKSLGERLRLSRRLAEKNKLLLDYQARNEEEQRIAAGYMQKMIALNALHDPAVEFHLKPAENFCGDLIAMARTPDGRLHLMLADSTGHGLSAALAAIPVINPFYSMTEKGYGISAIVREMNNMVGHSLPTNHFVAAIMASINPHDRMIEVWSGGCPPPVVLNSAGHEVYRFSPRHMALGIVPDREFDATVEYYFNHDNDDCCLLMFSDGVTELRNPAGEHFDLKRWLQLDSASPASSRWQRLVAALEEFSAGGESARDDVAVMMARCIPGHVPARGQGEAPMQPQEGGSAVWQLALSLSAQRLKVLDVVPLLLDMVRQIERDAQRRGKLFLILAELFNNALDHGLLKLDSALKHHQEGMENYFDERARRLAGLQSGFIEFSLRKLVFDAGNAQLQIHVRDSGDGFDYQHVGEATASGQLHYGKGIPLLNKMCSSVQYLGNGSEVQVCFDMPAVE